MRKIRVSDGTELAVWVHDFYAPWVDEEDKETILMHHGSVNDCRTFNVMVPILAQKYRVVRFDERGMGQSKLPPGPFRPTTERYVQDLLDIADALGLKKFHLYCQGSGGMIGVPFAVAHPDRLKTLTLCQTPFHMRRELIEPYSLGEETIGTAIRKYGFEEWNKRVPGYRNFDESKVDPKLPEWSRRWRAENDTEVAAGRYDWTFSVDLRDQFKEIGVPTLLINSAGSYQTPTEMATFMQGQNPLVQVATMEGGYGQALSMVIPGRLAHTHLAFLSSFDEGCN